MQTTSPPTPIRIDLEARETEWEIRPGQTVAGYGYNGQVPGPIIEARQGVPRPVEPGETSSAAPTSRRSTANRSSCSTT